MNRRRFDLMLPTSPRLAAPAAEARSVSAQPTAALEADYAARATAADDLRSLVTPAWNTLTSQRRSAEPR